MKAEYMNNYRLLLSHPVRSLVAAHRASVLETGEVTGDPLSFQSYTL